jgi:hypothetical protein
MKFKRRITGVPVLRNDIKHGAGSHAAGIKSYMAEQRIANAILQDKIGLKDTPLSRMTGYKTMVTYYQQKASGMNDYLVNTAALGSTDPNNMLFIKIRNFVILCQGETSAQMEQKETGADFSAEGQAKILPRTVKPMAGDYFIMDVYNKPGLFKVSNVNKVTMEDDAAYEINYQLVQENPGDKLTQLEELVSGVYEFVYSHAGTTFRTLFRSDEYAALEKLDSMHERIGSLFNEYFYDGNKNTYILTYDALDVKEEKPYVAAAESGNGEDLTPPSLNNSGSWYNSRMYDRMLVEFIARNRLFDYVGRHIFKVNQLKSDAERWYARTVFYAAENQTHKRLVFKYLLPSPVTRVTIASSLNLYGVVSLEPMAEKLLGSLDLYPPKLVSYILWEGKERSIGECMLNNYEDMLEFASEIIGLHVHKKDGHILSRLLRLHDCLDEFFGLSGSRHHMFYIFPLLAFVIRRAMARLSGPAYNLNSF